MRTPITLRGATMLREELRKLKSEDRPAIIRAIAEARSHGDLSENAEYHAAREQQGFVEGRIKEIEQRGIDDLGVRELRLELGDAAFDEALPFLRRRVLGIL